MYNSIIIFIIVNLSIQLMLHKILRNHNRILNHQIWCTEDLKGSILIISIIKINLY